MVACPTNRVRVGSGGVEDDEKRGSGGWGVSGWIGGGCED